MKYYRWKLKLRMSLKGRWDTFTYIEREFWTENECDAYVQGIRDALPWSEHKVIECIRVEGGK